MREVSYIHWLSNASVFAIVLNLFLALLINPSPNGMNFILAVLFFAVDLTIYIFAKDTLEWAVEQYKNGKPLPDSTLEFLFDHTGVRRREEE